MQSFITLRKPLLLLALGAGIVVGCRKDEVDSLEGTLPNASFTYTLDNSQFPVTATFTNTSTDAFLYQWDFGDGSPLVSGQNVTHTYLLPRTYQVRLVVAGRAGTANSTPEPVTIPSICDNVAFAALTDCATGYWTYSDQPGAITYLGTDGVTVDSTSSATLQECKADDQFSFTNSFSYSYDGGLNCGANYNGSSDFTFKATSNGLGQITLTKRGAFIGEPDTTRRSTYDIIEASSSRLRIRGTNANGTYTVLTFMKPLPPLARAERILTGGSSRTWILDNGVAATITVGTEAAPTSYFAGGALGSLPGCQADDEYTFTSTHNFIYDAKAQSYAGGPPEPVTYACVAPRSLTTPFTIGPASGTGLAQIVLAAHTPSPYIGATDASANRTYRILSINNREMVLRGGTSDPVFTIKMRVK